MKLAGIGATALGIGKRAAAINTGTPVSAFDFMTAQERNGVLNGGGPLVHVPLQQAIDEAGIYGRELIFPPGTYLIGVELVFNRGRVRARGEGEVIIKRTTGLGPVVVVNNPIERIEALHIENLAVAGFQRKEIQDGQEVVVEYTADAFSVRNVHRSTFVDIRVFGCMNSAFVFDNVVSNEFQSIRCSDNVDQGRFTVNPMYGIRIIGNSTANVFANAVMESPIRGTAIAIEDGDLNLFSGGTAEGVPYGISIQAASLNNTFVNFDCEQNTVTDVEISGGSYNTFSGCSISSTVGPYSVRIFNNATGNTFNGGQLNRVSLGTSSNTKFFGTKITNGISGSGTYSVY